MTPQRLFFYLFIFFLSPSAAVASRPPGRNEHRRYLHPPRAKREHHSDAAALFIPPSSDAGAAFFFPGCHISGTLKHFEKSFHAVPVFWFVFFSFLLFCLLSLIGFAGLLTKRRCTISPSSKKFPRLGRGGALKSLPPLNWFQLLRPCLVVLEQSRSTAVLIGIL